MLNSDFLFGFVLNHFERNKMALIFVFMDSSARVLCGKYERNN
jgi:hypothetical protein